MEEAPHRRLKSLIIGSDEVIYSLEFVYDDQDGKQWTVGPWGGCGPKGLGKVRKMVSMNLYLLCTYVFSNSTELCEVTLEVLTEVCGTFEDFMCVFHSEENGSDCVSFVEQINLGPSEVITEVCGTIGPADFAPGGVMKSLTIRTTAGWYGPFGEVEGTPFRIPVRDNGNIVGFFARAGWCIDALGIYVKPSLETQVQTNS